MKLIKAIWTIRALLYSAFTSIGKCCYVGAPTYISNIKALTFGDKVRIYPGLRVETIEDAKVCLGNNISIGQNFHIVSGKGNLKIADNVTISGNVFISNCDHTFNQEYVMTLEQPLKYADTKIGSECFIGYGAVILAGTTLGKHCVVGANSVVRGIFPDHSLIVGSPAKAVKRFNPTTREWERVI